MSIAAINFDALIPLIIGAFWVIAQIAGAAAKKKKPAPPRPAPEGAGSQTNDDPFAELMRKLAGVQEFKIPEPTEPEPIVDALSSPRPQPVAPDAVRTPRLQEIKPEPIKVPEIDIRPTMSSFKTAMPAMKLPAMNLSFQGLEKSSGGFPRVGNIINPANPQTLRRAILGHIILGKPKAMEGWSTGTVE